MKEVKRKAGKVQEFQTKQQTKHYSMTQSAPIIPFFPILSLQEFTYDLTESYYCF